ncbi:MAG: hypothetical protein U0795_01680 [Pirellulales bacterium]
MNSPTKMPSCGIRPFIRGWAGCLALVLAFTTGCGGYGEVSPAAYDHAVALYGLSQRQTEAGLAKVETSIAESLQRGALTDREAKWLRAIVDRAGGGDWTAARGQARRLMQDQVR